MAMRIPTNRTRVSKLKLCASDASVCLCERHLSHLSEVAVVTQMEFHNSMSCVTLVFIFCLQAQK